MNIFDFLITQGILTQETALEIKTRATRRGLSPVKAVLEAGIATPESLLQKLIDYTGLDAVDPVAEETDPDALRLIARETALEHLVLPMSFREEQAEEGSVIRLRTATADPFLNHEDFFEYAGFGCSIVLSSADLLEKAIEKNYSSMITRIIPNMNSESGPSGGNVETGTIPGNKVRDNTDPLKPAARGFIEIPTIPSHNIEDDVPPSVGIQAIVNILCTRNLMTREEYLQEIRRITETDDR